MNCLGRFPPDRYPAGRYPALYMADGGLAEDLMHVLRSVDAGIRAGELRPLIVVGIENTERRRDLTGPTDVAPRVGGWDEFRAFCAHRERRATGPGGRTAADCAGSSQVDQNSRSARTDRRARGTHATNTMSSHPRQTLVARLAALGLTLAGGACLHNPGNYATAQAAQKNFEEAKIDSSLDAEKELSARMRQAELAAVQKDVEAQRDLALAAGLNGTVEALLADIDSLLVENLGHSAVAEATYRATANLKIRTENLEADLHRYAGRALAEHIDDPPALACPLPAALKPPEPLKVVFANYADSCTKVTEAKEAREIAWQNVGGAYLAAKKSLAEEEQRIADATAAAGKLEAPYKAALADYQKLVEANEKPTQAAVDAAAAKVKAALDALKQAAGTPLGKDWLPMARIAELEARQAAVSLAVANILADTPSQDSLAQIVLAGSVKVARLEAGERLPVLLLEAEYLRGALETARTRARFAELRVALLEREHDALLVQTELLLAAERSLICATDPGRGIGCAEGEAPLAAPERAATPPSARRPGPAPTPAAAGVTASAPVAGCAATTTLVACFTGLSSLRKSELAAALVDYTSASAVGSATVHATRAMRIAAIHDEAIEQSAVAMRRWEGVLSIPIGEVVKVHAGGWKPEDVAALFSGVQAVGVAVLAGSAVAK